MKFSLCSIQIIWMFFVSLTSFGCDTDHLSEAQLHWLDTSQATPAPTEASQFRSGIWVYPKADTKLNQTLLGERDGYATLFTDPYGYVWTITTALSLTDQDFANAGVFLASKTDEGTTFYYGKVNTWEIQADCVAYVAASRRDFVTIRRSQDQGACPTSAGYAAWLPHAESPESKNEPGQKSGALFAYGANNHEDNIIHGAFQAVEVYGNDPYGWGCNDFRLLGDCLAYAGNRLTGAKWDSAEFVSRYLITRFNHAPMWQGPAKYWYTGFFGLKKMPNCGSVRPLVGDILLSNGGSHGHAAIVRDISDHSVTVIQQNWFESAKDNQYVLGMTSSGDHYCVSEFGEGYPVAGWLRK